MALQTASAKRDESQATDGQSEMSMSLRLSEWSDGSTLGLHKEDRGEAEFDACACERADDRWCAS